MYWMFCLVNNFFDEFIIYLSSFSGKMLISTKYFMGSSLQPQNHMMLAWTYHFPKSFGIETKHIIKLCCWCPSSVVDAYFPNWHGQKFLQVHIWWTKWKLQPMRFARQNHFICVTIDCTWGFLSHLWFCVVIQEGLLKTLLIRHICFLWVWYFQRGCWDWWCCICTGDKNQVFAVGDDNDCFL